MCSKQHARLGTQRADGAIPAFGASERLLVAVILVVTDRLSLPVFTRPSSVNTSTR